MGRKPNKAIDDDFRRYLRSGRDEMNLLEHSISSAGTKVDRSGTPIRFESETTNPETGEPTKQSWEVTFSGTYGRPTAADDDLFVAFMKLAQAQDFKSPRVYFTSGELIRILDWDDHGRSYKKIQEGVNRLCGVRVFAKRYWYDNKEKAWANRNFGIFSGAQLYDRPDYDDARREAKRLSRAADLRNWVEWSDVMQESFDAGYIRKLDLEFYRELTDPVSRKLYRYLGKQFWRKREHAIELETLAVEKLGYKPGTPLFKLRGYVKSAVAKLEASGAYGLSSEWTDGYGKSEVTFRQSKVESGKEPEAKEVTHPLAAKLAELGLSKADADAAVKRHSTERVVTDIEYSRFLEKEGRLKKSRSGTLFSMLASDEPWGRDPKFVSTAEQAKRKRVAEQRAAKERAEKKRRDEEEARKSKERRVAFEKFLSGLDENARHDFAEEALKLHSSWYGKRVRMAKRAGDYKEVEEQTRSAMRDLWQQRHGKDSTAASS